MWPSAPISYGFESIISGRYGLNKWVVDLAWIYLAQDRIIQHSNESSNSIKAGNLSAS
jgi:hypothetical protein